MVDISKRQQSPSSYNSPTHGTALINVDATDVIHGVIFIAAACFVWAIAGVYTEKVLKETLPLSTLSSVPDANDISRTNAVQATTPLELAPTDGGDNDTLNDETVVSRPLQLPISIWMRGMQLSFFSAILAALHLWFVRAVSNSTAPPIPFGHGFTALVWTFIVVEALRLTWILLVLKYTDNVDKGMAFILSLFVLRVGEALFIWEEERGSDDDDDSADDTSAHAAWNLELIVGIVLACSTMLYYCNLAVPTPIRGHSISVTTTLAQNRRYHRAVTLELRQTVRRARDQEQQQQQHQRTTRGLSSSRSIIAVDQLELESLHLTEEPLASPVLLEAGTFG